jgi:hypothetical protein
MSGLLDLPRRQVPLLLLRIAEILVLRSKLRRRLTFFIAVFQGATMRRSRRSVGSYQKLFSEIADGA